MPKPRTSRRYSANELRLFAEYRGVRTDFRPAACRPHVKLCWVEAGPPAVDGSGGYTRCAGCGASIIIRGVASTAV
jgi:hypothetical protein